MSRNPEPNTNNFNAYLLNQLWIAYLDARPGKRKTHDEHNFEVNAWNNLVNLRDDIIYRTYTPSRGVSFIIHDPVTREIFAPPFRDRIVHHFLYNICYHWWDNRLLPDSYSCREGKGTLYGQKRIAKHTRQATNNFQNPAFIVKADLRGYFMSLDRKNLVKRINWGLDRQFEGNKGQLYRTVKYLWKQVIMDDPAKDVKIRGNLSDWNDLPPEKSLFYQPSNKGIIIGALTSQVLSNVWLDQLDRFIHFNLGYKHYGRYVDDFVIIVPITQKEQLLRDLDVIRDYIESLGQKMHPNKLYLQDSKKGVPFIGGVINEGYIVPSNRVKRNCQQACRAYAEGHGKKESVQSYMGHLEHINSTKYLRKIFDDLGWEFNID